MPFQVVIVGGGHSGLIAASLLGKAGLQPLVLERAASLGGCAATTELAPGFRCPALAHRAAIDPRVASALDLSRYGLEMMTPAARVSAPTMDGRVLTLWADDVLAAREIRQFSAADAERYPAFLQALARTRSVLKPLMSAPPPAIDRTTASDLVTLLGAARRLRGLGAQHGQSLLRWMPMPIWDFVHEWFESEPLLATVAADGLLGAFLGPRSPGGTAALLLLAARDGHPIANGGMPRGGMTALVHALTRAAEDAGARIRLEADVRRIIVENGRASGVVLASGEEIPARAVISSADPRRTFGLVDPVHLTPEFKWQMRNVRMRGALGKVNFAVSSLPAFVGFHQFGDEERRARLSGCVRLCGGLVALERAFDAAKFGELPPEPWVELSVPSIADPSLAPAGQHVVSAYVQFAPSALRHASWDEVREAFGDLAAAVIDRFAPGFHSSIVARQVITPLDLERVYGLTGGHAFHGELALDQLYVARPLLGWARYRTPIDNLFLCGTGTHPGTGLDGRSAALAARAVVKGVRVLAS